jgi:hypothetical protein
MNSGNRSTISRGYVAPDLFLTPGRPPGTDLEQPTDESLRPD